MTVITMAMMVSATGQESFYDFTVKDITGKDFALSSLKGKKIIVLTNLAPRKLRGIESQGMLLAASNKDHTKISLLTPDQEMSPGDKVS